MNWKKLFALAALALSVPVMACQYNPSIDVNPPQIPGSGETLNPNTDYAPLYISRRFLYLAGINDATNHIAVINADSQTITYSAVNFLTLHPPFTIYVGAVDMYAQTPQATSYNADRPDVAGGSGFYPSPSFEKQGSEMETVTVTVQYRILPGTEWVDAATKKFSTGDVKILAAKKIYGKIRIDPPALAGSKVLVRLHVTVDKFYYPVLTNKSMMVGNANVREAMSTVEYIENADPDDAAVSSVNEIPASSAVTRVIAFNGKTMINGVETHIDILDTNLNLGLNILTSASITPSEQVIGGSSGKVYGGGWTDQYLMCFTVGDKRRPE